MSDGRCGVLSVQMLVALALLGASGAVRGQPVSQPVSQPAAQPAPPSAPQPPRELREVPGNAPLVYPDGSIEIYFTRGEPGSQAVMLIRSSDRGETWAEPQQVLPLPGEQKWSGGYPVPLLDRDGSLHLFLLDVKERGMATWHTKRPPNAQWTAPRKVCPSGPQTLAVQLRNGRIVLPIGYFVQGRAWDDRRGRGELSCWTSDDAGATWQRSPDTLVIPSPVGFTGSHYGAWEPVITELSDGRVWMVIRTQMGWLYDSFSDDGIRWSQPMPTNFRSSDAPGALARLDSGELVLVWNNCDSPLPVDGQWVYAGRDALHAAISSDDGKTWRGFREVYRDPFRNETPPERGDRGTAYPNAAPGPDGMIYLISGQGPGRSRLFRIDPRWLAETSHQDDFSAGLDGWSVFKAYGPTKSFRRERVAGAQRIGHPSKPAAWVLHVRRPDEKPGDGAVWNFPTGKSGKLALRILLKQGFGGGQISLTDRFNYPDDTDGSRVVFSLPVGADGSIGQGVRLEPETWHTLELSWKVEHQPPRGGWPGRCTVSVDGKAAGEVAQSQRAINGLSYLRLHSTAPSVDPAGFLVEHVRVEVEP